MADCFDKATRSRIMRAIKSRNTKPELALARALRQALPAYIMFSRRRTRLPGSPDFVVRHVLHGRRLALFMHGCFWHLCPRHYKAPASAGWRRKMDSNRRRDVRVRRQLRRLGWRTMVVWEHEDPARAAARVRARCERTEGR
jgi:DNA mismatch endonuclease (patch repair protein)